MPVAIIDLERLLYNPYICVGKLAACASDRLMRIYSSLLRLSGIVLLRTTLVGFHGRNANGHTSWSQATCDGRRGMISSHERWGIVRVAVNKNESKLAIAEKRRSGDSDKSGVECNGANIASQM